MLHSIGSWVCFATFTKRFFYMFYGYDAMSPRIISEFNSFSFVIALSLLLTLSSRDWIAKARGQHIKPGHPPSADKRKTAQFADLPWNRPVSGFLSERSPRSQVPSPPVL